MQISRKSQGVSFQAQSGHPANAVQKPRINIEQRAAFLYSVSADTCTFQFLKWMLV